MNRNKIFLIIALMSLSITGITLMQIHWMLKTIKLNEENFDRAVNETLTIVVDKLEKEKDINFSIPFQAPFWYPNEKEKSDEKDKNNSHYQYRTPAFLQNASKVKSDKYYRSRHSRREQDTTNEGEINSNENEFELNYFNSNLPPLDSCNSLFDSINIDESFSTINEPISITLTEDFNDTISRTVKVVRNDSESRVIIVSNGRIDTINTKDLPRNLIPPPPPPPSRIYVANRNIRTNDRVQRRTSKGNNRFVYKVNHVDSNNHYKLEEEVIALNSKEIAEQTKKQQQALKQLVYEVDARKMELKDRVNFKELKNLLTIEIKNKGLSADFEYALITNNPNRKEVFSTPKFNSASLKSVYSTRLFPNNYVPLNDFLEITFPVKDTAIYKSVILPISASLFFTLIVFLTFTITLVTIIKQKKLAEMKADFINNMTHELKTPIATISLASDSIDNPKVVDKPETVKYFTAIIREENSRMNKLVESVLQTARLERKTLKLNLKEVNLSNLTMKVADQMGIQVMAKKGSILFTKPEEDVFMFADANLMENVIFNLIDNAIKYSDSEPQVIITLKNLPGGISLSIKDNGIGMSRSEQQRVFEKFYRISQGDVHNIKGFGLGLSNVKEITELHGGMVQLRSELGKGSTFTLFFPNKVNGNE